MVRITERRAGVVIAAAILAALTGCTPTSKEATMTPHEARDTLVKTITDTAARLPVSGWTDSGAPSVTDCDANGAAGAKYGYFYRASPGTDFAGDAKTVADYWTSLGISVRTVTAPDTAVYGTGGPVQTISFQTAPGDYAISGTSLCVPGDVDTLIDEQAGD
ncbi:hypothetical protein LLS1_15820 [Leifsonia sp. LS1]|uniref:hypothetical protein n=1 Tax=unclassified Leifsonia TaxID=2663824 RepID=UPI001CC124DF|nr:MULTISPECIES: hypothetical protein [unclassified Leifsonia]UAJ78710.1 hypothetical protein IT072_15950 [Leifsonia sp. ZF2019]GIT79913.1 hypothetical protein LLS1_15820 [Leifsonia sp. LS1]